MPHIPKQNSASANFYARCKNPSALEGKRGGDRQTRTGLQLLKADLFKDIGDFEGSRLILKGLYSNKNILIIDIGTSITYDFLNERNEYLGGNISPGLNMRFKALNNQTHNLPLVEKIKIDSIIGPKHPHA